MMHGTECDTELWCTRGWKCRRKAHGRPWRVDHSIMINVTWRHFDQSAKQLIVGHTTRLFEPTLRSSKRQLDRFIRFVQHTRDVQTDEHTRRQRDMCDMLYLGAVSMPCVRCGWKITEIGVHVNTNNVASDLISLSTDDSVQLCL